MHRIYDKQNLCDLFGEINENRDYKGGWVSYLKKHENVISVSKTNHISNKWLDIVDGAEVPQNMVYNYQAMV